MKLTYYIGLIVAVCIAVQTASVSELDQPLETNKKRELSADEELKCCKAKNAILGRENGVLLRLEGCIRANAKLKQEASKDYNCPLKKEICALKGYTYNEELSMCYKWYGGPMTYPQAVPLCAKDGGKLATLDSKEKNDFFVNLAKQHGPQFVLIGGYYDNTNKVWRWEDGSKYIYTNWGSRQPETTSECVGFHKSFGYTWHDLNLREKGAAVCEI